MGFALPAGKNVHTSVRAKHDELTWFSSPFYAQIRTRATWPNARLRAVSQVYEAISEPVHFYCALKVLCYATATLPMFLLLDAKASEACQGALSK